MIHFQEISEGLQSLEEIRMKLQELSEKNINQFLPDDIRLYFPTQLNRLLIFNDLNLLFFENIIKDRSRLEPILPLYSDKDHFMVMESYIAITRLSLITGLSVVTERFLRKILEAFEKKENYNENIYNVREKLFTVADLDKNNDLWKAQQILFNVRNTMHNNSIFTKKGEKHEGVIQYAEKIHSFKFGSVHNSADFKTICFIIGDLLKFYSKLIGVDQIKQVDNIPELFKFDL